MHITHDMSKGQLVALSFYDDGITGTAVAMAIDALVVGVSMPFAGCLVAMSADVNAVSTHTSAALTFKFTKNASIVSGPTVALTYTTVKNTAKFHRDAYRFAAGDVVGVTYATGSGYGPNTIDGQCTLWIEADLEGV